VSYHCHCIAVQFDENLMYLKKRDRLCW